MAEPVKTQAWIRNSCRWPLGDAESPEFHFCVWPKVEGLPYCKRHLRIALEQMQERAGAAKSATGEGVP